MLKRIGMLVTAFFLIASVFSGCAKKEGAGNSDGGEINVDLDKNTTATLRYGITADPGELKTAQSFVDGFNKEYPNIKITIENISGDYITEVLSMVAASRMQDIFWVPDNFVTTFSSKNVLLNLEPYITASKMDISDFYASMLQMMQKNHSGAQYAMPRDYNHVVTYFNKAMFDDAGVPYPKDDWTWDEFLQTCDDLKNGKSKDLKYAVNAMLQWPPVYDAVIQGFGGMLFDQSGKSMADTAETKTGLKALSDLIAKGYGYNPFQAPSVEPFLAETTAMWFTSRPMMSNCRNAAIDFDVVTFPRTPVPAVGCGTSGYGICSRSTNKDASWAFLHYMVSKSGQEAFEATGNAVPVLKSQADSVIWRSNPAADYNHDAFVKFPERDKLVKYLDPHPIEAQTDIDGAVLNMLDKIYGNKMSIDDAAVDFNKRVQKILELD